MMESPESLEDGRLVIAARKGDDQAAGVLVRRHLASVFAVVQRIVRNRADAEDVAQETFMRALQRLEQFDTQRCFKAWLLKIATNLSLNLLRSRKRRRTISLREALAEMPQPSGSDHDGTMPRKDQWESWLGQLSDLQRSAIVLFHFSELPYAEVAEVLGMPINTVKTHIHRGRKRLREMLATEFLSENGICDAMKRNG